jgi:hypothetical protein
LHVTALSLASRCLSCGPHPRVDIYITGTIADNRYTLRQQIRYDTGHPTLQVGRKYPVIEVTAESVKVKLREQGKEQPETLDVITVEDVNLRPDEPRCLDDCTTCGRLVDYSSS